MAVIDPSVIQLVQLVLPVAGTLLGGAFAYYIQSRLSDKAYNRSVIEKKEQRLRDNYVSLLEIAMRLKQNIFEQLSIYKVGATIGNFDLAELDAKIKDARRIEGERFKFQAALRFEDPNADVEAQFTLFATTLTIATNIICKAANDYSIHIDKCEDSKLFSDISGGYHTLLSTIDQKVMIVSLSSSKAKKTPSLIDRVKSIRLLHH